ncbi:HalOD1 output domain-containing protein [Halosolutus halophilus]|uniref:HalOD1 output domain-containing protein n=1 Tax=Halosolutus halophilus TaxID=1552990 RepID=UPI002234F5DE|nr:HalOD1 output domain-containing protein [Halosolutus halophilus]
MSPSPDPSSSSGSVPPSQAIVEAIAARDGVDVTDVEPPAYDPLYTVINPEALDALFRSIETRAGETPTGSNDAPDARVVVEYEGYEITVYSDGHVELSELSAGDESAEDEPTGDDSTGDPIEE